MDLFEDLPEPSDHSESSESIPQSSTYYKLNTRIDIFSDLPTAKNEGCGIKRKVEEENGEDCDESSKTNSLYAIQGFFADKKGEREEMQDFHVLIDDFHKMVSDLHSSVSRLSYYAVFDGHGGVRASKFAAEQLHVNLALKFPKGSLFHVEREIKRTVTEAFKKTDEEFLKLASKSKPSWKDGTTAIVVLVVQNILYIANLGDSKAILCRYSKQAGKYVSVPLSADHSPTDYRERMRIQKAGGSVRYFCGSC